MNCVSCWCIDVAVGVAGRGLLAYTGNAFSTLVLAELCLTSHWRGGCGPNIDADEALIFFKDYRRLLQLYASPRLHLRGLSMLLTTKLGCAECDQFFVDPSGVCASCELATT